MSRRAITTLWILAGIASAATLAADDAPVESDVPTSSVRQAWEEWRGSGVWRTDYFRSSKTLDDTTGFLGATLELKALPSLTDSVDGKLELRVTNANLDGGTETRSRLLEGYARIH